MTHAETVRAIGVGGFIGSWCAAPRACNFTPSVVYSLRSPSFFYPVKTSPSLHLALITASLTAIAPASVSGAEATAPASSAPAASAPATPAGRGQGRGQQYPVRAPDGPGAPKFIRLEGPGAKPPTDTIGNYVVGPEYTPAPESLVVE